MDEQNFAALLDLPAPAAASDFHRSFAMEYSIYSSQNKVLQNNCSTNKSRSIYDPTLALFDDLDLSHHTTADKFFKCPVCHRICTDKSSFRKHYTSHNGEKNYKCPICAYKTNQVSNLYRHTVIKHKHQLSRSKNSNVL